MRNGIKLIIKNNKFNLVNYNKFIYLKKKL